jgi:hypothetical protein
MVLEQRPEIFLAGATEQKRIDFRAEFLKGLVGRRKYGSFERRDLVNQSRFDEGEI